MSKLGAALLAIVAAGVAFLLAMEIRRWLAGRHLISRRRFIIRLLAGAVLLGLLGAIASGVYWFDLHRYQGRAALFLGFWSTCLLAGVALLVLAIADLKEVRASFTQSQHQVWRDFARLLAAKLQAEAPSPAEGPSAKEKSGPSDPEDDGRSGG